jgi:YebC/PmpR family DNA-binding regulatory protein
MAGHSKWKNIQHRKGRQDAKKGKIFTKITKELMLAARLGGGDPGANIRLRSAIDDAKAVNLPKDKIETAIKKGTGEIGAENIEEVFYEGYGPGGVALLIDVATDNRNRTVAEIRHILAKNSGSMGESGCVAWMFDKKGVITFAKERYSEDQLLEIGVEAGAEDVEDNGDEWEVRSRPEDFSAVREAFEKAGFEFVSAEVSMVPKTTIQVDRETGEKLLKLYDALDENDDVQNVYANFDLPEELLQEMSS